MEHCKFTILIDVVDSNSINESVKSLINQELDFKENLQAILLVKNQEDYENSLKYQEKYPDNIIVLDETNSSYNNALTYAKGEFITFLNSKDIFKKNVLLEIEKAFSRYDVNLITIPSYRISTGGNDSLNYRFEKNKVVDLNKDPEFIHISLKSSFIKKEVLEKYLFNDEIILNETYLLNQLLLDNPEYAVINNVEYSFRDNRKINLEDYDKEFFTNFVNNFCHETINDSLEKYGKIPKFMEYTLLYLIREYALLPDTSKVFNEKEQIEYKEKLREILSYFSSETIDNTPKIINIIKKFLIYFKQNEYSIRIENNEDTDHTDMAVFRSKDYKLSKLNRTALKLDFVQLKNNKLNFSGSFSSIFNDEFIKIFIKIKSSTGKVETMPVHLVEYPTVRDRVPIRFLDMTWRYFLNFDFSYDVDLKEDYEVSFLIKYEENDIKISFEPRLGFGTNSTLSAYSHYFIKYSKIVVFKNNKIVTMNYSTKSRLKLELRSIFKILTSSTKLQFYYSIFIRMVYFAYWPFLRNKRIWLFHDRPTSADDNAKHLFKYAINQDDGIDKYFVVSKDVDDFNKMKEISNNIIGFKSLKNQIYYLYAEKVITTHLIDKFAHPLSHRNKVLYSGYNTSDKYFLQHGVTLGNISSRINKSVHNLSLFVNVSEIEWNSIAKNPNYNYDENIIQILGFPRYDNLKNENVKKQILVMPTWRSFIKDKHSLVTSEFYKTMNSLFTNEKLQKIMSEKGYKLIFRPHPELIPYLRYFDMDNENIVISEKESYQELFNGSSLLITDYSSVAFDFAYLKKPVIYYQYADEYNYDEGYFNFEKMGFGDVIEEEDLLIDNVIDLINNDCTMSEKYINRVNSFFKYTDKNNCERVYNWIYNDK